MFLTSLINVEDFNEGPRNRTYEVTEQTHYHIEYVLSTGTNNGMVYNRKCGILTILSYLYLFKQFKKNIYYNSELNDLT